MLKKILIVNMIIVCFTSCISTKSTIKNIDNRALKPVLKNGAYFLTEYASDNKYGHNQDYPINIGYVQEKNELQYVGYYFNAIEGPYGETLTYKKVDTCCPFPTKNDKMGGGLISVYEVTWKGLKKPVKLYFNIYERGKIVCPIGFSIKNSSLKVQ